MVEVQAIAKGTGQFPDLSSRGSNPQVSSMWATKVRIPVSRLRHRIDDKVMKKTYMGRPFNWDKAGDSGARPGATVLCEFGYKIFDGFPKEIEKIPAFASCRTITSVLSVRWEEGTDIVGQRIVALEAEFGMAGTHVDGLPTAL